jgi:hypothetical protein
MKSAALLGWLSVVALLCGSCDGIVVAQQAAPAGYPKAQERFLSCAFDTNNVVELKPGFNAATYGQCPWHSIGHPCPNNPVPNPNPTLPAGRLASIRGTIAAAFNNAPQHLKDELCTVQNIFIDADSHTKNSPAWGMLDRSRTNDQGQPVKYIGISADLFPDVILAKPYGNLETMITKGLLAPPRPPLSNPSRTWLAGISHIADPDDTVVKTMAILAHEMAHIIWWNENIPAIKCPAITGNKFQEITWQTPIINPHGFHGFGRGQANHSITDGFTEADMVMDLRNEDLDNLVLEMKQVYTFGNWVDIFSFVAPDEDFIESYKFWVLTNATSPLKSLSVYFKEADNSSQVVVPIVTNSSFGAPSSNLEKKRVWIGQWVSGNCA